MKKVLFYFSTFLMCFYCISLKAQSGKTLVLNGTTQYMTVPDHASLNVTASTSRTITMWFKTTVASGSQRLIAKRASVNGVNQSIGGIAGTGYEIFMGNSSGYKIGPNAKSISGVSVGGGYNSLVINDGQWHHVAWVLSNTPSWSSTLYLDGANMTTSTNASTQDLSNLVNLVIGAACDFTNTFAGSIDNVRMYNYAMTSTDVTTDKNTTTVNSSTASLLAAWDFEGTSGSNVPDVSGNNHPGTLVGSPTIADLSVNMQITSTSLIQTQLPVGMGDVNQRIIAVKVSTSAPNNPLNLSALNFTMNGTTNLADVTNIKVYYTGLNSLFNTTSLFATVTPASGTLVANGSQTLAEGDNYFFIAYDVATGATEGNFLDATCESVVANAATYTTTANTVTGNRVVLLANTLLFTPGDAGSLNYRIPAIITAADGSLVTVTDKRWNHAGDLAAKIDPVVRRSTDNGKTWSTPLVIANFGGPNGAGDAALVLDKTNGNLICLLAANKGFFASTNADPIRLLIVRSTDNGVTWGTPVDVSSQIYTPNPNWKGLFVASGRAHQLRDGKIVAAIAVREDVSGTEHINNYMITSTDSGITWTTNSGRAELDGDEAKVVELNNGNIMMSIRNSGTRRFNVSTDKGLTWGTAYNQAAITDPNCDGDFIRYTSTLDGYDKNRLLHTIPFAGNRSNVSVLMSTDEGTTWPVRKTIFSGASAYSSLTVLPDGTLVIYYENGESSTYQMYFARFSLNWLSNGTDTFVPSSSLGVQSNILNGENLKLNVVVAPNPTADLLKVKVNNSNGPVTIKIFNLSGKMIHKTIVSNTEQETVLSLVDQSQGIYIVQAKDANGTFTSKVIKK